MEWRGRLILLSRHDIPRHRLYLSELDSDYKTLWTRQLNLNHPDCRNGQEDGRLYHFGGRLRISFAGIWGDRQKVKVSQLWTELDDDLNPTAIYCPRYAKSTEREKNWGFFEGPNGEHLAVYSISPHVILSIDGDKAEEVAATNNLLPWSGGYLRGGAPPVRTGDTYTCFFHGNLPIKGKRDRYVYSTGVYEFEAKAPYRVLSQTPEPIMWGGPGDRCPGRNEDVDVVFVAGAFQQGGEWVLSQGTRDEAIEVVKVPKEGVQICIPPAIPSEFSSKLDTVEKLPGWCLRNKAEELLRYAIREKPKLGVEIGVFGGRSILPIALAMQGYGGVIYGVDPWDRIAPLEGMVEESHRTWWSQWDADGVFSEFSKAVSDLGLRSTVRIVQDTSANAVKMFADSSLDYLCIDGNHCEQSALRDAKLWWPKLKPGGVLYWDDAEWPSVQAALRWLDSVCDPCRTRTFLNESCEGSTRIYRKR